jgi:hypothetical protein
MQNDPYAQSDYAFDEGPQRTSALSIASLVTSLGCCIPGVGLIAIFLGVISLGLIGRSQGRLSGRAPAAIAIILGLMGTVIWGAIGAGALQALTFYEKQMAPVAERAIIAADAGNMSALRAEMTQQAGESITAERVAFFIATIESSQGEIRGTDTSFGTIINAFGRIYGGQQQGSRGYVNQSGGQDDYAPVPVVVACDNGDVIAWAIFDAASFGQGPPKLSDIMVQMPDQAAVALRDDGPAQDFVQGFGWTLIEPGQQPDAPSAPAPPSAPDALPEGSSASDAESDA